jgi:bis(5'-nucleosidyl)-tetraphosphatase
MRLERSAGVIVFCNATNQFLFIQGATGDYYFFPKGRIEDGELAQETALRELAEEVGISNVKLVETFSHQMEYTFDRDGEHYRKSVVFFLTEVTNTEVVLNQEVKAHLWLTYEEFLELVKIDKRFAGLEAPIKHAAKALLK